MEGMASVLKALGGFILGLIVGGLCIGFWMHYHASGPAFDTPYQAVLLDTGQVYYAKVEGLGTPFPVLHDVYYVQSSTDPLTKEVKNVLIRRGKELHGPTETVVNARHVVMVEPIGPSSKVAELIAQQQSQQK
jgi:hypothetical protein